MIRVVRNLFLIAFVLFSIFGAAGHAQAQNMFASPLIGKDAPKISLQKLKGGSGSFQDAINGKKAVMIFWATWCPTCKIENSTIDALSKKFTVITIAVNSGNDADLTAFLKEKNFNFKVINDTDATLAKALHVSAFPTTFIYDKGGNLAFSEVGYSSYFTLYLKLLYASR